MIDHIDPINRLIYLDDSTPDTEINPIDIYREVRKLRRTDESLRPYDMFMTYKGAEKKNPDGSKRTERYGVLLKGTLIVPYDTSHHLTITGTLITDDGQEGQYCFQRANLSDGVVVDIDYVPKQVEIITIATGSGITAQDKEDITNQVWNASSRTLTSGAGLNESDIHNALDSYANKDDFKYNDTDIRNAINAIPLLPQIKQELINVNYGKLVIDPDANTMTIYDKTSSEVIVEYDLYDNTGTLNAQRVYRREPK